MWKELKKITLKALVDVRIRVDGEKRNVIAGELIEVDERNLKFYLINGFGYENDNLWPTNEGEEKVEGEEQEDEKQEEKKEDEEQSENTVDNWDIENWFQKRKQLKLKMRKALKQ